MKSIAFMLTVACAAGIAVGADADSALVSFKHGQPRAAQMAVEAEIRGAKSDQLPALEARLLKVLQSPEATTDAKGWAARTLRFAGSEQCVAALLPLLKDPALAAHALYALHGLNSPKVDDALRSALGETKGVVKAGVLQTLGARAGRESLKAIVPALADGDPVVVEAALYALGQMGGGEALQAIKAASAPGLLKRYREHALLLCAESVLSEGHAEQAALTYRELYQSEDLVIKQGALRGVVNAEKARAAALVSSALSSQVPQLRAVAAKTLCESGDADLHAQGFSRLGALPADVQAMLLELLNHPAGLAAAREAAASESEEVRAAALGALGRVGDASILPVLVKAASGSGATQTAARKSLLALRGDDIDGALVSLAQLSDAAGKVEIIHALAGRVATNSADALLKLSSDPDATVRGEALTAVGRMAQPKHVVALVELFLQSTSDADRMAAETALGAASRRAANKEEVAAPLLDALTKAGAERKPALLRLLARVPCAKGLDALRAASNDPNEAVQDAAVRGLADWPDASALPALAEIARSNRPTHRVLALRGYIRLAAVQDERSPEARVKALSEAMTMAASPAEKKLVLAQLGQSDQVSALDAALGCVSEKELEVEAATAALSIAERVKKSDPQAAASARKKLAALNTSPAIKALLQGEPESLDGLVNIAGQGVATSPDGLKQDGAAKGEAAAIDGDPNTYWDQTDNAKLYQLVVTFKQPRKIVAISVMGYEQHNYAPKDFDILADGKVIQSVANAQYRKNLYVVRFPEVAAKAVELKITGYYGKSPAIRELGIYENAK